MGINLVESRKSGFAGLVYILTSFAGRPHQGRCGSKMGRLQFKRVSILFGVLDRIDVSVAPGLSNFNSTRQLGVPLIILKARLWPRKKPKG